MFFDTVPLLFELLLNGFFPLSCFLRFDQVLHLGKSRLHCRCQIIGSGLLGSGPGHNKLCCSHLGPFPEIPVLTVCVQKDQLWPQRRFRLCEPLLYQLHISNEVWGCQLPVERFSVHSTGCEGAVFGVNVFILRIFLDRLAQIPVMFIPDLRLTVGDDYCQSDLPVILDEITQRGLNVGNQARGLSLFQLRL